MKTQPDTHFDLDAKRIYVRVVGTIIEQGVHGFSAIKVSKATTLEFETRELARRRYDSILELGRIRGLHVVDTHNNGKAATIHNWDWLDYNEKTVGVIYKDEPTVISPPVVVTETEEPKEEEKPKKVRKKRERDLNKPRKLGGNPTGKKVTKTMPSSTKHKI